MGLLDRFKSQPRAARTQPIAPTQPRVVVTRAPSQSPSRQQRSTSRPGDWIPPHCTVIIDRYTISGGLLYVGGRLPAQRGAGPDPALIDPDLPVGRTPDRSGQGLRYWPGYGSISPNERAAYLEWLANGRSDPSTPIGYVFLYFYGLERRVLVDCAASQGLRAELPMLRAEVARLLSIYGKHHSLRRYAMDFLGLIDLMLGKRDRTPPEYVGEKWPVPLQLRVALGEFSRTRAPIPGLWALSWAMFGPEIYPRTPVSRCGAEFTRLFCARYASRFGPGMVIVSARSTVTVDYRPASAGLEQTGWQTRLPDVFELAEPLKILAAIVEEATAELDAYSRWLGRHPGTEGTLQALALLPSIMIDATKEPVSGLLGLVNRHLAAGDQALIDGLELIKVWGGGGAKLAKQESTALAQFLAGQGVGLEPDPRFGGSPLGAGPAVVFRIDQGTAPQAASAAYTTAATLVRLAAAVASADTSSGAEQDYLVAHVESALELAFAERRRLHAHLLLLLSTPVKLTGMTTRLSGLSIERREQIARLCVAVAAADGVIAPSEVTTLTKIYKLLELPATRVFQDIHAATATEPAGEPITVRPASLRKGAGHLVPAQPNSDRKRGLGLDRAAITAKLAETARVSELLGSIFVDDEAAPVQPQPTREAKVPLIADLDAPHSRLLHDLASAPTWSRTEVEDMCTRYGLLTDGALEVLNDAAFTSVGDPVVFGEDPLEIDLDVIEEMQR